jgi:integrase
MGKNMGSRIPNRLTALAVTKAKEPGLYADGLGLYLAVSRWKTKSWIFRFRMPGASSNRDMGLGSFHSVSLQEARLIAQEARRLKAGGIDPIENRKSKIVKAAAEAASLVTFRSAANLYIQAHCAGWRNVKHGKQWEATLGTYAFPKIGDVPVKSIDAGMVIEILEPIWRTKTETATRVRNRIERILDWAAARGYRSGENPARWRGHLENLLPRPQKVRRVQHHPALQYSEVGSFVGALKLQPGDAADALMLLILTASRTSEVIGAKWAEFDLRNATWTIPADRIKAAREHRVPLSPQALRILEKRQTQSRCELFLFPGRKLKPMSNGAILMLLERMGRGDITAHGFRSTFRDWASEQTNFPGEVAEMALAHVVANKTEAAYRRGDIFAKRKKLMEGWGSYCEGVRSAKVIQMRRA